MRARLVVASLPSVGCGTGRRCRWTNERVAEEAAAGAVAGTASDGGGGRGTLEHTHTQARTHTQERAYAHTHTRARARGTASTDSASYARPTRQPFPATRPCLPPPRQPTVIARAASRRSFLPHTLQSAAGRDVFSLDTRIGTYMAILLGTLSTIIIYL